jgi:hypothetical protein
MPSEPERDVERRRLEEARNGTAPWKHFYLDSTPTHSYMKYLYKYPHAAYPYQRLIETNRARSRQEFEYELLDTGVFDANRYFDVFVEYAKASPEDILIRITVENRGPDAALLHVLPTLWFRQVWSAAGDGPRPALRQVSVGDSDGVIAASDAQLGERWLFCEGAAEVIFTENETNTERLFGSPNRTPFVKDGIDRYIVHDESGAVNPEKYGTKASAHYCLTLDPGASQSVRLRLSNVRQAAAFGAAFDDTMDARRREADRFYAAVNPPVCGHHLRREAPRRAARVAGTLQEVPRGTPGATGFDP